MCMYVRMYIYIYICHDKKEKRVVDRKSHSEQKYEGAGRFGVLIVSGLVFTA